MMEDCQLKIMQNFAEQSLGNPHGSTDIQIFFFFFGVGGCCNHHDQMKMKYSIIGTSLYGRYSHENHFVLSILPHV